MKKASFKKLSLRRDIIAQLNKPELGKVHGAGGPQISCLMGPDACPIHIAITDYCPQLSLDCLQQTQDSICRSIFNPCPTVTIG